MLSIFEIQVPGSYFFDSRQLNSRAPLITPFFSSKKQNVKRNAARTTSAPYSFQDNNTPFFPTANKHALQRRLDGTRRFNFGKKTNVEFGKDTLNLAEIATLVDGTGEENPNANWACTRKIPGKATPASLGPDGGNATATPKAETDNAPLVGGLVGGGIGVVVIGAAAYYFRPRTPVGAVDPDPVKASLQRRPRVCNEGHRTSTHWFPQIKDVKRRYCNIEAKLKATHDMIFKQAFGWERWHRTVGA